MLESSPSHSLPQLHPWKNCLLWNWYLKDWRLLFYCIAFALLSKVSWLIFIVEYLWALYTVALVYKIFSANTALSFFIFCLFLIGGYLLYSVVLVSAIQHESAISVHMSSPSWAYLPPSNPFHPSRLSQSTMLSSLTTLYWLLQLPSKPRNWGFLFSNFVLLLQYWLFRTFHHANKQ